MKIEFVEGFQDEDDLQDVPDVLVMIQFDGENDWFVLQSATYSLRYENDLMTAGQLQAYINDWRKRCAQSNIEFRVDESVEDMIADWLPPSVIACYDELAVHEWTSGYEIEHIPSGKTHWMSDGVDMLTREVEDDDGHGFHDETLSPGTEEFNQAMQHAIEEGYNEYLEAYFPEIAEAEDD